jgi:hypothetical protein
VSKNRFISTSPLELQAFSHCCLLLLDKHSFRHNRQPLTALTTSPNGSNREPHTAQDKDMKTEPDVLGNTFLNTTTALQITRAATIRISIISISSPIYAD